MEILYIVHKTEEEKPKVGEHVIVGWDEFPLASVVAHLEDNGYWFLSNEAADCDEPDWWLEKVIV